MRLHNRRAERLLRLQRARHRAQRAWGQFHNRRKDGSIFWEPASISPVRDGHGVITHYIAVKEDITARKRVEALLRWHHPERGPVSPEIFVPLAEETGVIGSIGRWVLREAGRQAARWHAAGLPIRVNVNLSSRRLALGLEVQELRAILAETGAEPGWLALEVTEGLILDGSASTRDWLQQVKAPGLGLSVDDFGTGYSSLSYLKRFPMDGLKIDRSFVNGLPGDRENASLIKAILAMARSLGLSVVAEGVETQAQLDHLQAQGCGLVQGWLYRRPVAPERIAELAARGWSDAETLRAAGP